VPFDMFGPYIVAIMMSIGAVCVFIWAVLSGALGDSDEAALRFYRAEVGDDRDAE
jgi:nitrogen fixation-related uncharacterized protein